MPIGCAEDYDIYTMAHHAMVDIPARHAESFKSPLQRRRDAHARYAKVMISRHAAINAIVSVMYVHQKMYATERARVARRLYDAPRPAESMFHGE